MVPIAVVLCSVAVMAAESGVQVPSAQACRGIVVVMPKDGWRLLIDVDGGARINYAELPQTAIAAPGTFQLADVRSRLVTRVDRECPAGAPGTVEFVGADGASLGRWCLADEAFGIELFEQAWNHLAAARNDVEREHQDLLRDMWARSRRASPAAERQEPGGIGRESEDGP